MQRKLLDFQTFRTIKLDLVTLSVELKRQLHSIKFLFSITSSSSPQTADQCTHEKMESRGKIKSRDDQGQRLKSDDHEKANLSGDYGNVAILFLLYLLQGIPLGITFSIPILLQKLGVSYKEQAAFSFAFYPFTGENEVK